MASASERSLCAAGASAAGSSRSGRSAGGDRAQQNVEAGARSLAVRTYKAPNGVRHRQKRQQADDPLLGEQPDVRAVRVWDRAHAADTRGCGHVGVRRELFDADADERRLSEDVIALDVRGEPARDVGLVVQARREALAVTEHRDQEQRRDADCGSDSNYAPNLAGADPE